MTSMTAGAIRPTPVAARLPDWVRRDWVWVLAVFFVVTVWTWLRIPLPDHDVVWAEDGVIFLKEQIERGTLATLLHPYAGYQHFLPRLFSAAVVEWVPLESYNRAVFTVCVVFAGLTAAATYRLTRGIIRWIPARVLMSLIPVAVPLLSLEIIGNFADLHTYCLWLAAWIALSKPASKIEGVLWGAVALVACLTEVQALLVVPIFVVRLVWDRSLPVLAIAAGTLIGVGTQMFSWLTTPRPIKEGVEIGIPDVVVGWLVNAVLPIWNGHRETNSILLAEHGWKILALAVLPFALAALAALIFDKAYQRFALCSLLFISAASFGGSLLVNPHESFQYARFVGPEWFLVPIDLRYGAAAALFVLAALPFAASSLVTRFSPRFPVTSRTVVLVLSTVVLGYVAIQGPEVASAKTMAKPWSTQVESAVLVCEADPASSYTFESAPGIRYFDLACEDVLDRASPRS